jgi:hypothetical protein
MCYHKPTSKIRAKKSPIHGVGVFATGKIYRGQIVLDDKLKEHSGFNHSCNPNVLLVHYKKDLLVAAMRDIIRGEELTVCYPDIAKPKDCNCGCCK